MPKILCPNPDCRKSYRVSEESLGARARCKKCGTTFEVSLTNGPEASETHGASGLSDTRKPTAKPSIPQKIGRFEISGELGSGGFGIVYRALDTTLKREVALKVPNLAGIDNKEKINELATRFLREAEAVAQFHHPNIVQIYDTGNDGSVLYQAAQLIDGVTLKQAIKSGKLNLKQRVNIVRQLAEALAYAHEKGTTHRDVKPANVMLDKKGHPYLMDFGLARFQETQGELTQDASQLGTPLYMSPEQASREKLASVGPLSDQYSLGVVLYEMLTGKRPFEGSPQVVMHSILTKEATAPSSVVKDIPRDLETICQKAMAKESAQRYPSCSDLVEDLRRWFAGEPILARPAGKAEIAYRWAKRNPAKAGLAATLMCGCFLGIFAFFQYLKASKAREFEQQASVFQQKAQVAESTLRESQDVLDQAKALREQRANEEKRLRAVAEQESNLADLEQLKYVTPVWKPDQEREKLIADSRKDFLKGSFTSVRVRDLPWFKNNTLDHGYGAQMPSSPFPGATPSGALPPTSQFPQQDPSRVNVFAASEVDILPDEFILRGYLWGIRKVEDKTWLFLGASNLPAPEFSRYDQRMSMSGPPMAPNEIANLPPMPIVGVVFLNDAVVEQVPDYALGEVVDVLVQRKAWGEVSRDTLPFHGKNLARLSQEELSSIQDKLNDEENLTEEELVSILIKLDLLADLSARQVNEIEKSPNKLRTLPKEKFTALEKMLRRFKYTPKDELAEQHAAFRSMVGTAKYKTELRLLSPYLTYWCALGQALMKPDLPDTYVHVKDGRGSQLKNANIVLSSPGNVLRNSARGRGHQGGITGRFMGLENRSRSDEHLVYFSIQTPEEGKVIIAADMGTKTSLREFYDYRIGEQVEASIELLGSKGFPPPASQRTNTGPMGYGGYPPDSNLATILHSRISMPMGMPGPSLAGSNPITNGSQIDAKCTWVRRKKDPKSLVLYTGPRRVEIGNRAPESIESLDDVVLAGKEAIGKEVSIDGRLESIGREQGVTTIHVSCKLQSGRTLTVSVTTKLPHILNDLRDYISDEETDGRHGGDQVQVQGAVVRSNQDSFRTSVVLELMTLMHIGRNDSLVTVDKAREEKTFVESRVNNLHIIKRDPHATVVETTMEGVFEKIQIKDDLVIFSFKASNRHDGDFVAYTDDISFLDNLADYCSEDDEDYGLTADRVMVSGTLKGEKHLRAQRVYEWPIVELGSLERSGAPESKANVGKQRDPESFDSSKALHPVILLDRYGGRRTEELTYEAVYDSYSRGKIRLKINRQPFEDLEVAFPNTTESMFGDYREDDAVTVRGKFTNLHYDTLKLDGILIVRKANVRSEVSSQGRAIAALDFKEHEDTWEEANRSSSKQGKKKNILMAGKFAGIARDGNKSLLNIQNLFLKKYGGDDMAIPIGMNQGARDFFELLTPGDEILFETLVLYRRERRSSGGYDYEPSPQVLWISRIGHPDEKVKLSRVRD